MVSYGVCLRDLNPSQLTDIRFPSTNPWFKEKSHQFLITGSRCHEINVDKVKPLLELNIIM